MDKDKKQRERLQQCNIDIHITNGEPHFAVAGGDTASVTMALADACGAISAYMQNICGMENNKRNVIIAAFAEAMRQSWVENYDHLKEAH